MMILFILSIACAVICFILPYKTPAVAPKLFWVFIKKVNTSDTHANVIATDDVRVVASLPDVPCHDVDQDSYDQVRW